MSTLKHLLVLLPLIIMSSLPTPSPTCALPQRDEKTVIDENDVGAS
ncbi:MULTISPECIES: hypothetical protein [Pseudomonas]|nr:MULTISPECIES: hypothetical protein [Pseudomonas]UEH10752.1 hypothetical protein LJX92_11755 [Pseudomonas sp. HN8-3]